METHSSHVTRFSDSSLYDEVCVNCGLTDNAGLISSSNGLKDPCTNPPSKGGQTYEQWKETDNERILRLKASMAE